MSHKYPCIYYDNGKCQKFSDDHYTAWCVFSYCEHQTPSNGDKIRAMSDEELAEKMCDHRLTKDMWLNWLRQPYKEDGGK